jgi:hypothetical protein
MGCRLARPSRRPTLPVPEASSEETPYGRYITSDGWFVLNLADALAVRNEEKGGTTYPLESRDHPFRDVGVRVVVLPPGQPNALYHSEQVQEASSCSRASAR